MLPNIIAQSPLILPDNPLQRTLHILLFTPSTPARPATRHTRTTLLLIHTHRARAPDTRVPHTPRRALTPPLLLEPAALGSRACGVSVRQRGQVADKGRVCGGGAGDAEGGGGMWAASGFVGVRGGGGVWVLGV